MLPAVVLFVGKIPKKDYDPILQMRRVTLRRWGSWDLVPSAVESHKRLGAREK
jgi:hypothetical protein